MPVGGSNVATLPCFSVNLNSDLLMVCFFFVIFSTKPDFTHGLKFQCPSALLDSDEQTDQSAVVSGVALQT